MQNPDPQPVYSTTGQQTPQDRTNGSAARKPYATCKACGGWAWQGDGRPRGWFYVSVNVPVELGTGGKPYTWAGCWCSALIHEPVPPGHLKGERYGPYFEDVMALGRVYGEALTIARELDKKRLPRAGGYDGDVRKLLEHNLVLQVDALRGAS